MKQFDKLLHYAALGFAPLAELTFDIEKRVYGRNADSLMLGQPVFVVGLARGGTSVITRLLHETGEFSSLTYRDMPFPLAPNLWAGVATVLNRSNVKSERGHGDGLTHDLDSPEALEEVFWRLFEGSRYLRRKKMIPATVTKESINSFRMFVALVARRYASSRYLSKNNNNILRLDALELSFSDAIFLHPVRDPIQQSASLLNQHRRAVTLHADDPFRARYMRWLAHHEFGSDHRPFIFEGADGEGLAPDDADYWLSYWVHVYSHLRARQQRPNSFFIDFDRLCREPQQQLEGLADISGTKSALRDPGLRQTPSRYSAHGFSPGLVAAAYQLHAGLIGD